MRTCFFMGAHDASDVIGEELETLVEYLVLNRCVTEFVVGSRGHFDAMAISAIRRVLRRYPEKGLTALLLEPYPFSSTAHPLPELFHGYYTPDGMEAVPRRFCISVANQKALAQLDVFVTFTYLTGSNSGKMLHCARALERQGRLEVYELKNRRQHFEKA